MPESNSKLTSSRDGSLRTPRWLFWLRAVVGLPLCTFMGAVLLMAAWPASHAPKWIRPTLKDSMKLLDRASVSAGQYVFGSYRRDRRRKTLCWVMLGLDESGEQHVVYETYERCELPTIRWHGSLVEVFLQRQHLAKLGDLADDWRRPKTIAFMRNSTRYDRISEYFCESGLYDMEGIKDLYTVFYYQSIGYKRSDVETFTTVVHRYSCADGKRIRRGDWPRVDIEPGKDPVIVEWKSTPDKAPSTWTYHPSDKRRNKPKKRKRTTGKKAASKRNGGF